MFVLKPETGLALTFCRSDFEFTALKSSRMAWEFSPSALFVAEMPLSFVVDWFCGFE